MSKLKLIEDESEEEEIVFKTNNEFAQKYEKWREKEELHKLEQKYGPQALNSEGAESSDSDDDSLEPPEMSEEMEAQFLKTLALLKTKDQRIYDPNYEFFDKNDEGNEKDKDTKPKEKTLSFADSDEEDDDNDGAIFSVEKKAVKVTANPIEQPTKKALQEGKLKEYLIGKVERLDSEVEKDLAPLKALWSDPKLSKEEAFLRDYILNKRYLEAGDAGAGAGPGDGEGEGEGEARLRDDAALEEDAQLVEEQRRFERAYNFRYEEPDTEYLKRYPRTVAGAAGVGGAGGAAVDPYVRPKDQRRARRRAERAARKLREKQAKREELARLRALKLKEIREKLDKIKEVTGNDRLPFDEQELESEFDPAEHDRRMRELFDERYYGQADDAKPEFPDLDRELEIENWEQYEDEQEEPRDGGAAGAGAGEGGHEPHCEDEDFNMDAECGAGDAGGAGGEGGGGEGGGGTRRARRRRARLARLLGGAAGRAPYVPGAGGGARSYAQHMDEYYRLECEDVIGGDLPTRFKYREVPPNDYGLTVEEILLADDKELTQWVPLKRVVKLRSARQERSDLLAFRQRAADPRLKRRLLPSLYRDLPQEPDIVVPVKEKAKSKKKKAKTDPEEVDRNDTEFDRQIDTGDAQDNAERAGAKDGGSGGGHFEVEGQDGSISLKKKKRKRHAPEEVNAVENCRAAENSLGKLNGNKSNEMPSVSGDLSLNVNSVESSKCKKKKKNKKYQSTTTPGEEDSQRDNLNRKLDSVDNKVPFKKKIDHGTGESVDDEVPFKKKKKIDHGTGESVDDEVPFKKKKKIDHGTGESVDDEVPFKKKKKIDHGTGESVDDEVPFKKKKKIDHGTGESVDDEVPFKKKKKKIDHGTGESVDDEVPFKKKKKINHGTDNSVDDELPFKKKKIHHDANTGKNVIVKNKKINKNKNFKHNKSKNNTSDNPLSKISDERLKAYGLNPKKYRSFLKYKKF